MANENAAPPIAELFSNLFHGFPRLLFTNLLFAVPAAVFFSIFYAINSLSGINSIFLLMLTVIPVFPFYAGVVQVTAHLAKGEENVAVFSNFIAGVKENFLRFLVHGAVFYLCVFFTYSSITLYFEIAQESKVFYALMVFCVLIGIIILFVFYYIPSMTVTFDLKMKSVYKNSLLMSFGEIKSNLIATFGLFLLFVVCSSVLMCCGGNIIAIAIVTAFLVLFFVPSIASFIINSAIRKRMYIMIIGRDEQSKEVDKKLADKRGEFAQLKNKPSQQELDEELKKLDIDSSADADEYIYYNGKMVKRSVLLKLKNDANESEMN